LGLSIASQVIGRHGGTIEAAPAQGRRTIVTVRLPLAPVQRQEDVAAIVTPVSI
jgi:signal transduction histidine kinase